MRRYGCHGALALVAPSEQEDSMTANNYAIRRTVKPESRYRIRPPRNLFKICAEGGGASGDAKSRSQPVGNKTTDLPKAHIELE
jgi:hypothetical protein